ncbi:catechol 1,2-dioxygenase [Cryobacterium sp. PH29-G1]|uniref:catechol 1,2-dioxygenase n=1 Tax=Cryobacterium sp. PH29-G1 TaxID=3046211 RepID=UPI0024B94188|nr:catechol 1,2-dioxygenase [Cryobacterium sp. PH29-G1]MDJ0349578.1 catechol 1,2-dioxygenase [Cryobacterium sp. PH29-G1]
MSHQVTDLEPSAAASGNAATDLFRQSGKTGGATASTERVSLLANEVLAAVYETVRKHEVTYEEFNALKAWLIQVGEDGEWPLFLDVWVEHVIEEVATSGRTGSKGTIEGPYYVPNAPQQATPATLPMRDDEPGTPLVLRGTVTGTDGTAQAGAHVEIWHADDDGFYSQFAPGLPQWNLRGIVVADEQGNYEINTVQPAPYQIPTGGSCGNLITAAGWHAWRPAHLHLKVSAPGRQLLTAQLYFEGDSYLSNDIASAVKPELILRPTPTDSGREVTYDFLLDPA